MLFFLLIPDSLFLIAPFMTRQNIVSFLKGVTYVGVYGGLLMPLVFIPIVIFPFVFSKLVFFQALIGLTLPAYILLAWMEPKYRPKVDFLYGAIAAYFVAIALSMIFAEDPMRAWWGNQERMNGLFTLLHFLAWLTMTVSVLPRWNDWRRLLNYEAVLSAIMGIVALLQLVYPRLLLFPASGRVGGLLDNPIYMGAYQIFNLAFIGLLFLKARSLSARIFYGVVGVIDIAAFIAAQSRGALVGLGAGIIVFVFFYACFTKNKKARYGILGFLAVLMVGYGLIFTFRETAPVKHSIFYRLTDFSGAVTTRLIAWRIGWEGFKERPLTGWGFDNFHLLFNHKYNPQSLRYGIYETWFDRAHNTIVDVISMTGIFGLITFFLIFAALFISIWRAFRHQKIDLPIAAILFGLPVAYFVQNLFVFDHPAGFSMSFLLYAIVIAATRGEFIGQGDTTVPVDSANATKHKRGFSWFAYGLLQCFALFLVWRTSLLPFEASRLAISANNAFGTTYGFSQAQAAEKIWTPYVDEQSFLLSRNLIQVASQGNLNKLPSWQDQYALAKRLNEEELRRHSHNTHPHLIYAQLAAVVAPYLPSEAAIAEREYLAGIETSPKRQQLYYGLGNLYLRMGRKTEMFDLYRKVKDFDLDLGEGHWMYGLVLFYDKPDAQEGSKELLLSQSAKYPHIYNDARELIPMADAYITLGDKEGLRHLVDHLSDVPVTQANFYAQLAFKYHLAHLDEEQEKVLAFAETQDPSVRQLFQNIVQGGGGVAPAPAPTTVDTSHQLATGTKGVRGPRR